LGAVLRFELHLTVKVQELVKVHLIAQRVQINNKFILLFIGVSRENGLL
jgi:hypothetical protein